MSIPVDGSNTLLMALMQTSLPLQLKTQRILSFLPYAFMKYLSEVYQQRGEGAALQAIALMHQGKIISLDDTSALHAAKCSIDHNLPMADSTILAISRLKKATI